jgi:flagellar biogenesis protein FliO
MFDELIKKENALLVMALICLAIWYYRQQINQNEKARKFIDLLPTIGGLIFGFNTLIQLTK